MGCTINSECLTLDFLLPNICNRITHMQRVRERGATAVEYGLFVALIATVIVISVTTLGQSTIHLFDPVVTFFAGR